MAPQKRRGRNLTSDPCIAAKYRRIVTTPGRILTCGRERRRRLNERRKPRPMHPLETRRLARLLPNHSAACDSGTGLARWDRPSDDSHMGLIMLLALLGGLIFGAYVFRQTSSLASTPPVEVMGLTTQSRHPTRALSGAAAPLQSRTAAEASATPAAQLTAAPQPTAVPASAWHEAEVTHTDGTGVVLRASPNEKDWTPRGFMDGTIVTVLERQGSDWARVRGPNDLEGWVPARYLEPR